MEIQLCITEINYILKYIKIETIIKLAWESQLTVIAFKLIILLLRLNF